MGFQNPATLSAKTLTLITFHELPNEKAPGGLDYLFTMRRCLHCLEPACASACLVAALKKTSAGPVTYDAGKCIGCRYCIVACPLDVPRYEWMKLVPYVKKCDMCAGRQANQQVPGCVEACPTGASIVGWRDEILEEAQRRILGGGYVQHIYGSEEAG